MKGRFQKHQHPLFLEDENIFQKLGSIVPFLLQFRVVPWRPIFEKCSHLREKGGLLNFSLGLYGRLYGQNLLYKFKNSYGDFQNRNFEKITMNYWSPVRSETGLVILSKFWSRYDFQNIRNQKVLGEDQELLSKGTVSLFTRVGSF